MESFQFNWLYWNGDLGFSLFIFIIKLFRLPKIRVQDRKGQYDETLSCIDRSAWSHNLEMNQTDQIAFTAKQDGSMGYQLLENENYILFAG